MPCKADDEQLQIEFLRGGSEWVHCSRDMCSNLQRNGYPQEWVSLRPGAFTMPWYPECGDRLYEALTFGTDNHCRGIDMPARVQFILRLWELSKTDPAAFEAEVVMNVLRQS